LRLEDGQLLWTFSTGGAIRASAGVSGQDLYVHSDDGYLYRLHRMDGTRRWAVPLYEERSVRIAPGAVGSRYDHYASTPVVRDGVVYVGAPDGQVSALSEETGDRLWTYQTQDAVSSTPVVSEGRAYFGSFDGWFYALDARSGQLLWRYDTGAPVVSSAAIAEGAVLLVPQIQSDSTKPSKPHSSRRMRCRIS